MRTEDLRRGDRVRARVYREAGLVVMTGIIAGFTQSRIIVDVDEEYRNVGRVVAVWYTDVLRGACDV